jgi:nucleotidyltransferase/DNA polymerase involved in DNA repair
MAALCQQMLDNLQRQHSILFQEERRHFAVHAQLTLAATNFPSPLQPEAHAENPGGASAVVKGAGEEEKERAAALAAAREARREARERDPSADHRPRTSKEDPQFLERFYRASRLHYIGMWNQRYQELLADLGPPPPLPLSLPGGSRCILHIDIDCFFAQVSTLGRPELRGRPVAVSWSDSTSAASHHGEISCANYAARARGLRAGMFIGRAKELCPELITVPYEFEKYTTVACAMYRAVVALTPHILGVSCDEVFADATALCADPAWDPPRVAQRVRAEIVRATGCSASVGSGPNRLLARVATKHAKPDGQFHIEARDAESFLAPLPVSELPGVGYKTLRVLQDAGITTVAELRAVSRASLRDLIGEKHGALLGEFAAGNDPRRWEPPVRKSVGAQATWGVRFDTEEGVQTFLQQLAETVAERMSRAGVRGKSVQLLLLRAVRDAPERLRKGHIGHGICDHLTRSRTLSRFTAAASDLAREALLMAVDLAVPPTEIRGLGLSVTKLDTLPSSTLASASRRPLLPPPPTSVWNNPGKAPAGYKHPMPAGLATPVASIAAAPPSTPPGRLRSQWPLPELSGVTRGGLPAALEVAGRVRSRAAVASGAPQSSDGHSGSAVQSSPGARGTEDEAGTKREKRMRKSEIFTGIVMEAGAVEEAMDAAGRRGAEGRTEALALLQQGLKTCLERGDEPAACALLDHASALRPFLGKESLVWEQSVASAIAKLHVP